MQPRRRNERQVLAHKESLEKERLKNRTGAYFRYEECSNPISVDPKCPAAAGAKEIYCMTEDIASVFIYLIQVFVSFEVTFDAH